MRRIRELADRTPPERDRYLDLLRAVAITAVVLGHWLVSAIERTPDGHVVGHSALQYLPWARPVTWLVQVMPVFFLVGGYVNAASLSRRQRRGGDLGHPDGGREPRGDGTGWLIDRGGRLVRPTTALLVTLAAGAGVARLVGADPTMIRAVVWVATIPLWFLVAYLAVVALTPITYALHRRYGLAVPLVLVLLVGAGDLARLAGSTGLAGGSYLFGWLAVYQAGFVWRDRDTVARGAEGRHTSPRPRWAVALLLGGLGAAVLLTLVGPYPISMINVPGERLHNMSPPSLALLAVATAQLGLIVLLRAPAERRLRRPRPWRMVVLVNTVVLTVFLWHMTAVVLLVGALDATGLLPTPPVRSLAWLAWRLPWLVLLLLVLGVLVAVFGRIEIRSWHRPSQRPGWLPASVARTVARSWPRTALTVVGFAVLILGLLGNSLAPKTAPASLGVPAAALVAYLAGAATLRLLRSVPDPPPARPG